MDGLAWAGASVAGRGCGWLAAAGVNGLWPRLHGPAQRAAFLAQRAASGQLSVLPSTAMFP